MRALRVRAGLALLILVCLASFVARGQAPQQPPTAPPPESPQPQPIFRAGANLVRVDVTVVDRRGNLVTSLTADDFEVEEDGVAQSIQTFQLVEADGQALSGDDESLPIRSPEHAAAEAARDDVRVFLIFWDEYHINRFASAIRGREALTRFVNSAFAPRDLVALIDQLTPTSAIRFTRDRSRIAMAVPKLEGRRGVYLPPRSDAERAQLEYGDIERLRAEVTVSALKATALYLGGLREGRKAIIFISEGVGGLGRDGLQQIQDAVRAANDSNTAIYTVDPRGLVGRSSDSLWMLADNTGGRAILNTNGLSEGLKQVVKEASAFYLLGYSSTKNPSDGKFHQIKVRLKQRSGLDVRARQGYWAPSAVEIERARVTAAAAEAPPEVAEALALLPPANAKRVVDLWTGTARGANGESRVSVAWAPRVARGERPADATTVSLVAQGADGQRYFEGTVDRQGASFGAPPGALVLQVTARDANGNVVDEQTRPATVPDFSGDGLTLSTPVVLRAQNALDFRAISSGANATPFAGREVLRTDRLLVRFSVHGDPGSSATLSARLVNRRGTALVVLPILPLAGQNGTYQIDLPLGSVAQGEFLISIEATRGEERVQALVPLRVVS